MTEATHKADFLIVGGGVSGICCAQTLAETNNNASIILITAKDVVKLVTSSKKLTRTLEELTVEERPSFTLSQKYPNVAIINDMIVNIDPEKSFVVTRKGSIVNYKKLCICTGAKPNLIENKSDFVLGIRDVDSVAELQNRLKSATRIVVIGNGGIALELVYELAGCEVIWAIKDEAIGNVFLDKAAAEFLLPTLNEKFKKSSCQRKGDTIIFKRQKYGIEREMKTDKDNSLCESMCDTYGGALGPDWSLNAKLTGMEQEAECRHVHINYNSDVRQIMDAEEFRRLDLQVSELPNGFNTKTDWAAYVALNDGKVFGADLIISATGVKPNTDFKMIGAELMLAEDGGIQVDHNMRTNIANIYAAGDACSASWDNTANWFQMRLWTQAYQMGSYAAKCMTQNNDNEEALLDMCFEMFAHVTIFFGYKLCLLGRYNAQGLVGDYELLVRYTPGKEYVKVILKNGRMVGSLLLGETDLEETFENLILNEMDLSQFGESLLDPDVEIEDFFD